jgi:hypothetical protein
MPTQIPAEVRLLIREFQRLHLEVDKLEIDEHTGTFKDQKTAKQMAKLMWELVNKSDHLEYCLICGRRIKDRSRLRKHFQIENDRLYPTKN